MTEIKRTRRKEARPDDIITAAMAEFAAKGFAATSMGGIAKRAGIARPTVYLYYGTKDAIFEAAVADRFGAMLTRAEGILAPDAPFAQVLEQVLRNYYDRVVGTDAAILIRVLIAEGGRFPGLTQFFHDKMLVSIESLFKRLVAIGIDRGEVRPAVALLDLKVILAPAVFTVVFGLIFGDMPPDQKEQFIQSHITLILNGLLA